MASSSTSSSSEHVLLLLLFCGLLCSAWPSAARDLDHDHDHDDVVRQKFKEWRAKHGREYKSEAERLRRLSIFADNMKYVKNASYGRGYTIGLNKFADLTNEEFLARHTGVKLPTATATSDSWEWGGVPSNDSIGVPSSIDWRSSGVVTAVKNQGPCGSCWAFSAVAAIESAVLIKTGQNTNLSEQELVDCDTFGSNKGCQGGLIDEAFAYVALNGGIATEAKYPYAGSQGVCRAQVDGHVAAISGFVRVHANDEEALMEAVARQPMSVSIDAGGKDFQFYKGGVYEGPCGTNINHAVTVVGYGEDGSGNKFWIVKNSWGRSWGDMGYVLMKRDAPQEEGLCGIAIYPSYPTVVIENE